MAEGLSATPKTFVSKEIIPISATIEGNGLIFMQLLFYYIFEGIERVVKDNHLQQSFSKIYLQTLCIEIMWETKELCRMNKISGSAAP